MIFGAEAALQALDAAMGEDPTVLLFGEDLADREGGGVMGASKGLSTKYGDLRVRSTPISEQAIMGAAVGAAIAGMRPVAEIMLMNFLTVCMDQIVNHAAKIRFMSGGQTSCPLTIRTMTGVGAGLGGQHSDMLEAWFAHVPGLKVVVPSNHADWTGLLHESIMDDNPVLFVESTLMMRAKGAAAPIGHRLPLGKANVARTGSDVSVIGYGRPINDALAIAEKLSGEGVSVEVIDLRTVAPWDKEAVLTSVAKTGRAVIVHEAVRNFGCGGEIAATIGEELFGQLKAPIRRVGSRNTPVPVSPVLEKAFAWSQSDIEAAIRSTLN
ncbi:alpha-ketoacid dehydrogenase subunit beta [Sphingomonas immobilis]|uniref:Transketolase C-terminal domain-containing protein n=1 Tax=Sphingomonas immobilis TaxID=3063997 RepID=A0ABT8ZY25_9SPHN|nr:transketolase C-terminal domain-containing protein [Sphingomonas sp. CA1-15]MDO7842178.1 transketolase C-terminal domain-containing protein [Sphingomonas sp. CA1-15]